MVMTTMPFSAAGPAEEGMEGTREEDGRRTPYGRRTNGAHLDSSGRSIRTDMVKCSCIRLRDLRPGCRPLASCHGN